MNNPKQIVYVQSICSCVRKVAPPTTSVTTVKAELSEEQKAENAKIVLGDLDMFD